MKYIYLFSFLITSYQAFSQLTFNEYRTNENNDFYFVDIWPGDMDADGDLDLVSILDLDGDNILAWFENVGVGNDFIQHNISSGNSSLDYVAIADFDNDGINDVVAIANLDNAMYMFKNNNNGNSFVKTQIFSAAGFNALSAFDFNGDGNIDLGFSTSIDGFTDETLIWENPGNGDFLNPNEIDIVNKKSELIKIGDINNDGIIDILLAGNTLDLYLNDGLGNYQATTISDDVSIEHFEVIDFDGDSDLDIIIGSGNDSELKLLENKFPDFQAKTIENGTRVDYFVSGDFDLDGDFDFVIFDARFAELYTITQGDPLSFESEFLVYDFLLATQFFAEDFNGDGKLDLANCSTSGISIFENSTTTSIIENSEVLDVKAFPNPSVNHLVISIPHNSIKVNQYCIYNIEGKELKKGPAANGLNYVDISNLPIGSYFLVVLNNDLIVTRISIQRQ